MGAAQSARAKQDGSGADASGESEHVDYYELLQVSTKGSGTEL